MTEEASNQGRVADRDQVHNSETNEGNDTQEVWRSTTTQGERARPPVAYQPGTKVTVNNQKLLQFDMDFTVSEAAQFNEDRWGWDYKLKDLQGVRQTEKFAETDLDRLS